MDSDKRCYCTGFMRQGFSWFLLVLLLLVAGGGGGCGGISATKYV